MSHEINLIALTSHFEDEKCVLSQRKGRTSTGLHTLTTGDLVLRDQHQYLMQHCIEKLGVSLCHYYAFDPLSKLS